MGGNHWLNLVYFDECMIELKLYFKIIKKEKFFSETELKTYLIHFKDKFFHSHSKYIKFQPQIRFEFITNVTKELGKLIYIVDDYIISKI